MGRQYTTKGDSEVIQNEVERSLIRKLIGAHTFETSSIRHGARLNGEPVLAVKFATREEDFIGRSCLHPQAHLIFDENLGLAAVYRDAIDFERLGGATYAE